MPTEGRVRFRGVDLDELDPLDHRRRVGMVFQRPTAFPGTVHDNLLVARPDADADALRDALHRAALDDRFLDRPSEELSGGEAQRMCMARTLVTRPEVVLLDEPTSALDPSSVRELEQSVRQLADAGMAVVWVTHDLAQSERVADERVVMVGGRLAGDDEIAHYLTSESVDHDHPVPDHHHHDGGEIHRPGEEDR